jgi:hypothetical protein
MKELAKHILRYFQNKDMDKYRYLQEQAMDYISKAYDKSWVEFYQPVYDPNNIFGSKFNEISRTNTQDRVDFINQNVDWGSVSNYLDIGSQIGYFVFKISEGKDIFSIGMEKDPIAHNIALNLNTLNGFNQTTFINNYITNENVKNLMNFDVISFLNVFHHIVHFDGFESADNIMKELAKKCSYFIFETGQYDERGYYWSEDLSFMGDNAEDWLTDYLTGLGLEIVNTKKFDTHLSNRNRTFFICKNK